MPMLIFFFVSGRDAREVPASDNDRDIEEEEIIPRRRLLFVPVARIPSSSKYRRVRTVKASKGFSLMEMMSFICVPFLLILGVAFLYL